MTRPRIGRRRFIRDVTGAAAVLSAVPAGAVAAAAPRQRAPRIKFAVIGINHSHIYGQVGAVLRGGGELTAVYAKEADLLDAFSKRYPQAKRAASEQEILEDSAI